MNMLWTISQKRNLSASAFLRRAIYAEYSKIKETEE